MADEVLNLRASGMPLAFTCPGSVREPKVKIRTSSGPADLGTCGHEVLRPLAEGGSVPWEALPEYANRYGVDLAELRIVVAGAFKLWKLVKDSYPGAVTEVPLSMEVSPGVTLSGHPDILSVSGTRASIGDWKSGRKDSDYGHQLKAYGALVLNDDASLVEAALAVLWTREGDVESLTMDRDDARTWLSRVRDEVVGWDGVFHPGSHCDWCQNTFECPAARAQLAKDVSAVLALPELVADLSTMPPSAIISLLRRAKQLAAYGKRVPEYVKEHVQKHGDVVDPVTGTKLTIETGEKRELKVGPAWHVLEDNGFGSAEFAEVVTLSIGGIEDIVAKRAGKGNGAAAVRDLGAKLTAADAVILLPTSRLSEKPGRKS
jgi:hypothetical protein